MFRTAKEMLAAIDQFLATAEETESIDLWNILTALRGPDDSEERRLKRSTTAIIRRAAFPTESLDNRLGAEFATRGTPMPDQHTMPQRGHFAFHVQTAFAALSRQGLKA